MKNQDFKVQLFRFVDVLPYLNTADSLQRHIEEYFTGQGDDIPAVLKWGAEKSGLLGGLAAKMMGKAIRSNIEGMARQFIIGENTAEAIKNLNKLRKDNFAFTVDLLGEADGQRGRVRRIHAGLPGAAGRPGEAAILLEGLRQHRRHGLGQRPAHQRLGQALGLYSQASPRTRPARWRPSRAASGPSTSGWCAWAAPCASTWRP